MADEENNLLEGAGEEGQTGDGTGNNNNGGDGNGEGAGAGDGNGTGDGNGNGAGDGDGNGNGNSNGDGEGNQEGQTAKSLLDDDDPAEGEPKPMTEEEQAKVKEFISKIPAVDLGEGVKWDDQLLTTMAPSLMKMTGGDATKANELVNAYVKYTQAQVAKRVEESNAFNKQLREACKTEFGADFDKIRTLAKKGGAALFSDKLWKVLRSTPELSNNPDFIRAMADYGRRIQKDSGKVGTQTAAKKSDEDLIDRFYSELESK